jgi:hypothetical protein
MRIIPLSSEARLTHNATHKVIVTYADVVALGASATGTLALLPASGTFPAGTAVAYRGFNLTTAFDFSDASINSLAITVGDGGSANRFQASTQIAVDGTEIFYGVPAALSQPYPYEAADTVDCFFTAAGGGSPTLAEATSGQIEFYFHIQTQDELELAVGGGGSVTA